MVSDKWSLEILSNKGSDLIRWNNLLEHVKAKDVYFTPAYMGLFEKMPYAVSTNFGGEPFLAFYGNEDEFILYPFFKRSLFELDFCHSLVSEYDEIYDIISPWFFSGILFSNSCDDISSKDILTSFFDYFHKYCLQQNIVSEFMRLHPFIKNHKPFENAQIPIEFSGDVVFVDLRKDKAEIISGFKKSNRNCVSKSKKNGVNVTISNDRKSIDQLFSLYTSTMMRVNAHSKYFFPKSFFYDLFDSIGDDATLFIAEYNNVPIAASVFLNSCGMVHYYLSGSNIDYSELCPTNLLLYEAIIWAKEKGYFVFELGGGYKKEDGLYKFKSSFSKKTNEFYVYKKIHNKEIYSVLCRLKSEHEGIDISNLIDSDYFPAYRI